MRDAKFEENRFYNINEQCQDAILARIQKYLHEWMLINRMDNIKMGYVLFSVKFEGQGFRNSGQNLVILAWTRRPKQTSSKNAGSSVFEFNDFYRKGCSRSYHLLTFPKTPAFVSIM